MAILFSKQEKSAMLEIRNSVNAILSYHKRGSENNHILNQRLQRLKTAQEKFNEHFIL